MRATYKEYYKVVSDLPPDDEPDFTDSLRKHGVIWENDDWIVVPNVKYNKENRPWLTIYLKRPAIYWWDALPSLHYFIMEYHIKRGYELDMRGKRKIKKYFIHCFLPKFKPNK